MIYTQQVTISLVFQLFNLCDLQYLTKSVSQTVLPQLKTLINDDFYAKEAPLY